MSRQRFCKVCEGWHDLEEPWPEACMGHYRKGGDPAHQVIRDLEPYKSMKDGSVVDGRAAHREHLKRHNLIEIGNEYEAATKRVEKPLPPVEQTMKRAMEALESGYRPRRPMTQQEFES